MVGRCKMLGKLRLKSTYAPNRADQGVQMKEADPFSYNAGYREKRCPICWRSFGGWNCAVRVVLHYLQDCRGRLADGKIREQVFRVLGRIELRMNQRALLRYAREARFFAVTSKADSISLHSLRRLGMMTIFGRPAAPLRDRFWHITALGDLVLEAFDEREREIAGRKRTARTAGLGRREARAAA